MSGLSDTQAKLLELAGAIGALEYLALEASFALAGPPPLGDPLQHDLLERFRLELVRMREFCRAHGWPGARP